jgi:hypothetical protein
MTYAAPFVTLLFLAATSPVSASCVTERCGVEHQPDVEALRAEIEAACDCPGSANHRAYTRCAKTRVRTAQRNGRVSKACGRAVTQCEVRSTCGREGAVVCCGETRGATVGKVKRIGTGCRNATVCTEHPHAVDACAPDARCCVSVVERGPPPVVPPGSPIAVATGFEVRANGPTGCAGLDGPLVALNWFSLADRETFLRYETHVGDVLRAHGHRATATGRRIETLMAPAGTPTGGGSYEHEAFALAWYSSAGGFLDFLRSEALQTIVLDQQAGARQSDYVWGLQRCIIGCAEAPPPENEILLAHIFRDAGGDLDHGIQKLAGARGAPAVFYAAENVAELRVRIGSLSVNPQKPPWGRGAIVFRVASRDAAVAWIANRAYTSFRRETAEDVIVLLQAGII